VPDVAVEMIEHGAFGGPLRVRIEGDAVVEIPPDAARAVRVTHV
jgi:hypothetical protein